MNVFNAAATLLVLVGPTGIGKTQVAIELCEALNGEIVSADSMQIYLNCDIVTAKPTREERQQARHHLLDICNPTQTYSAVQWAQDARAAIANIWARGKQPIIAGGTGFYINALLKPDLAAPAPPNPELRAQLELLRAEHGAVAVHGRLQLLDVDAAQRLHPNDFPRVSRAIEVAIWKNGLGTLELGFGSSAQSPKPQNPSPPFQAFRLTMPREQLYARLNARVDVMLHAGALAELRELLKAGVPRDAPALRGVGYKELLPAIDNESRLLECVESWKRETRRYAKRQETWFRGQIAAHSLDVAALSAHDVARVISEKRA